MSDVEADLASADPVEVCRKIGHDIVDGPANMTFTPPCGTGRLRWHYPLRVRLCERCGWLEFYADVRSRTLVLHHLGQLAQECSPDDAHAPSNETGSEDPPPVH